MQNPIRLDQFSEPQSDIALLQPRADFYAFDHPGPADVFLIVEVADTSVGFDPEVKIPLYARAGIPEVWLVDLTEDCITVYGKPSAQVYQDVQRLPRGQSLSPESFPDLVLAVEDILGQP